MDTSYLNAQYVSAPEKMWRLLEFKMHKHSHAVIRLPAHLLNRQQIIFEEGNEEEAIAAVISKKTKLEAWVFKLN